MAIAAIVCAVAMILGALWVITHLEPGDSWWNARFGAPLGLFVVASLFFDYRLKKRSLRIGADALLGVLLGLACYSLSGSHADAIYEFILSGLVVGPLLGLFKEHL